MIGVNVTVPVACFRKGLAREFLETESLPPPATCYGFLLSLVGETDRRRHVGARVAPVLVESEGPSQILRTVWRVKNLPLGSSGNERPDYQQLLTNVRLVIWVESGEEADTGQNLEQRVLTALTHPKQIKRFGGLSLGESTHLVDEVNLVRGNPQAIGQVFLRKENGRLTLPVWVDHVGSSGTRYVTGDLEKGPLVPPDPERMPVISSS